MDTQHLAAFELTENTDGPDASPQVQLPAPTETWSNKQQESLTEIGRVSMAQISTYSSLDGALVKRRKLTPVGPPLQVQVQAIGLSNFSVPQAQDLTPFDETRHMSSFSSLFGALQ